jgi:type IV pilus assembly protein PilN
MRFDINLASQPYQDVRQFLIRWGVAVGVLAVLMSGLVYSATKAAFSWRITRQQVSLLEQQIADREHKRAEVEAFLNRPENSETRDRSRFLNALIARKAFSWTEVFTDLERIVPAHLKVVAIRPAVNDEDQLIVRLRVTSPQRGQAIELVSRIEQSPHFRHATISSEGLQNANQQNRGQAEVWEYEISAIYIPGFARPQQPAAAVAAKPPKEQPEAEPAHIVAAASKPQPSTSADSEPAEPESAGAEPATPPPAAPGRPPRPGPIRRGPPRMPPPKEARDAGH